MQQKRVAYFSDVSDVELTEHTGRSYLVTFQGVTYRLDLTNDEAIEMEKGIQPYLQAGTRVGGRREQQAPTLPKI